MRYLEDGRLKISINRAEPDRWGLGRIFPQYEFHVGCYDLTSGTWHGDEHVVCMVAASPSDAGCTTGSCEYSGLKSSHHYAIAFKAYNKSGTSGFDAISGRATVW